MALAMRSFGDDIELTQAPARFGLLYFHNDAFDGRKALTDASYAAISILSPSFPLLL
jgi:hypothetical protein